MPPEQLRDADEAKEVPEPIAGYAAPAERPPLLSYAIFAAIFNSLLAAALSPALGRELPERIGPYDVVLVGAAAHKLSRVISKDKVTSFVRAPFTELEGKEDRPSSRSERAGSVARRAIGELLICPYCLGLWVVAAAFAVGLLAPRLTRRHRLGLLRPDHLRLPPDRLQGGRGEGAGLEVIEAAAEAAIAASQRAASPRPSSFHAVSPPRSPRAGRRRRARCARRPRPSASRLSTPRRRRR